MYLFKFSLLFVIVSLIGISTYAKSQTPELVGKVKKLNSSEDIYVGAGYSPAGEPIYFGMEKITEKNYPIWDDYKFYAEKLTGNRGLLLPLSTVSDRRKEELENIYKKGFSEYLFELARKMAPNKKKLLEIFDINGIPSGINGFKNILAISDSKKDVYVVYISDKPVRGPFTPKLPISKSAFGAMTVSEKIQAFDNAYADVIMSVGVEDTKLEDKQVRPEMSVEHRGIFRNPLRAARDEYKGLALLIHGFAGDVILKHSSGKKYMHVKPTITMANILHQNFKPGEMFIDPNTLYGVAVAEKFPPLVGRENIPLVGEGAYHFIMLEALKNLYEKNAP